MKRLALLFALCTASTASQAEPPTFDYEMTLIEGEVARGKESLWRFTITNTGNTPISSVAFGTNFWEQGGDPTLLLYEAASTAPCTIAYTDFVWTNFDVLLNATVFWRPFPIAPGDSRHCDVALYMHADAPSQFAQVFGIGASNAANEGKTSSFSRYFVLERPTAIPAWSRIANLITAVLVFSAGGMALLRSR